MQYCLNCRPFFINLAAFPSFLVSSRHAQNAAHLSFLSLIHIYLYGDSWTLERGMSGVFGKNFYNYISEHTELGIKAQGYDKKIRREIYTYEGTN